MTTQRLGHGRAVVVAGDANEARNFLVFQLLYGGKNAVRTADAVQVVEIAQAVDLDQIEIVRLEKFEAGFYGAQRAIAVSRINLGGEKDILSGASWKTHRDASRSAAPVAGACRSRRYRSS